MARVSRCIFFVLMDLHFLFLLVLVDIQRRYIALRRLVISTLRHAGRNLLLTINDLLILKQRGEVTVWTSGALVGHLCLVDHLISIGCISLQLIVI